MPPKTRRDPATWAVTVSKRSTDAAGVMHVEGQILDGTAPQANFFLTITASRNVQLVLENVAGSLGFNDFQAWMKENPS